MKNARLAAAFAAILVALTGCSIEISTNGGGDSSNSSSGDTLVSGEVSTEKSYTYSVDNSDDIKIGVNTSLGYDITSEVPFTISKNGETAFQGSFIYSYAYEDYRDAYEAEPTAVFLGEGTKDGNEYFAYSLPDEVDYFILISGSNTAVLMGSLLPAEDAAEAFDAVTFSLE